jgi:hypothetical protein
VLSSSYDSVVRSGASSIRQYERNRFYPQSDRASGSRAKNFAAASVVDPLHAELEVGFVDAVWKL